MRKVFIGIGYLIIVSIFIFSLKRGSDGPDLFPHFDKVGHCFSYFLVTYWFCNLYPRNYHKWYVLIFTQQGIVIEFLQRMTGYRTYDYLDMLANFTGCLIAFALAQKHRDLFRGFHNP